jgi:hypothetical protein
MKVDLRIRVRFARISADPAGTWFGLFLTPGRENIDEMRDCCLLSRREGSRIALSIRHF